MNISFVIPHKGRIELLERTLESILGLDWDAKTIELIVVTQNKTLDFLDVDLEHIAHSIVFRPEQETISTLRNIGAARASGDYLVFLDADIRLSPNWLKIMFEELDADPARVLVSAIQYCGTSATKLERIRVALNSGAADRHVEFMDGRNLFLKKETFVNVGGFPEHLITCEDYYFTHQVRRLGKLYCSAKASYIHLGEDTRYNVMFRKEIWRGQSNLHSMKGRSIPLREMPSFLVPFWIAGAVVFSLFFGAVGIPKLAGGCVLMAALPIVLYAIRLFRLGNGAFGFFDSLIFYLVYFPARIIGTIAGLFRAIIL